jgi:drug/metabolite transporter (DMT)-like permease
MTSAGRGIGVGVILISTCFEALGQLSFKRAADGPAGTASALPAANGIAAAFVNWRWVLLGYAGFIADGLLWSAALYFLDVSVAHPIGSVVFVVVAVASRLFLRERITPRRWAGIGLILVGSAVVALS